MAPRGRQRKPQVGLTRMDAALDAMGPYGFPKELVRKTVKELLKVYGGDGWVFIEEGSYNLLIETILQKQDNCEEEKGALKDESSQHEARGRDDAEPSAAGPLSVVPEPRDSNLEVVSTALEIDKDDANLSAAGPSSGVPEPRYSNLEVVSTALEMGKDDADLSTAGPSNLEVVNAATQMDEDDAEPLAAGPLSEVPEPTCSSLGVFNTAYRMDETRLDHIPQVEGGRTDWKDIALDRHSGPRQMNNVFESNSGSSTRGIYIESNRFQAISVENIPAQRRKPCHGWIGSDEDEELVQLTPAASREQWRDLINGTGRWKEHKRRWDVKPDDF